MPKRFKVGDIIMAPYPITKGGVRVWLMFKARVVKVHNDTNVIIKWDKTHPELPYMEWYLTPEYQIERAYSIDLLSIVADAAMNDSDDLKIDNFSTLVDDYEMGRV